MMARTAVGVARVGGRGLWGRREGVREGVNGKRMVLLSSSILCSAAMYSF